MMGIHKSVWRVENSIGVIISAKAAFMRYITIPAEEIPGIHRLQWVKRDRFLK